MHRSDTRASAACEQLKQFLRSEELKNYNDLTISWEVGKNPDLFIYNDAGELKEKHDLSKMEVPRSVATAAPCDSQDMT